MKESNAKTAETKVFQSSRWTKGNRLFPTRIAVSPIQVVKIKRSWFSSDEESIHIQHVSSVRIKTGLLWSDIWIESSGGTNQIYGHGHTKKDAQEIKRLIEEHQRVFKASAGAAPGEGTFKCPFCAETIKVGAKLCRFCNRDLA